MHALINFQSALLTECLITHCTAIRVLTTMYTLMFFQIIVFTECFITHFTQIWKMTPM